MRLVLICNEAPFPATHGGRVDVWRRLCAMRAAGADILLVFWSGDRVDELPSQAALARMRQEVSDLAYFVIPRTSSARASRLFRLLRWSSHVASRVLGRQDKTALMERITKFQPDAVWLDSIYGGVLAKEVVDQLDVPLFYRSHNIEHLYMRRQIEKAASWRDRMIWSLNILHLKEFEFSIIKKAKRYFDISQDDLQFWKHAGYENGEWLPPMIDARFAADLSKPMVNKPEFDVGYLGNLFSPNNVDGVLWFLNEVVPKLRLAKPDVRIFIAGSKPIASIIQRTKELGLTLLASPEDVVPVLRNARVLINPVFAGSGVNIKSVEMLFCPAEIVSTSQGLAGLPTSVKHRFRCADTADAFSMHIVSALAIEYSHIQSDRAEARALFSYERGRELIYSLRSNKNKSHHVA